MYKVLRIIFCVLAAVLAAACILVFVLAGILWGIMTLILAAVCGALMVTFKQLQEREELKANPPPPQGDFITGKPENKDKDEN